jgi:hypothetical protein
MPGSSMWVGRTPMTDAPVTTGKGEIARSSTLDVLALA